MPSSLYGKAVKIRPAVAVKLTHSQAPFRSAVGKVVEILPNDWVLVKWASLPHYGRTPFHSNELVEV